MLNGRGGQGDGAGIFAAVAPEHEGVTERGDEDANHGQQSPLQGFRHHIH